MLIPCSAESFLRQGGDAHTIARAFVAKRSVPRERVRRSEGAESGNTVDTTAINPRS
jgi:hypothetical protein